MMAMMMTFLEELGLSNYQRQGNTGGEGMVAFPHSPLALFFFFEWRSARAYQFHFLGQDQSKVAQRAETTVARCSLTSCV